MASPKTFKTKPFLLATAGSTVDGRVIDEKALNEMASSYDPKTYGARVNIEHIRGVSATPPFNSYGDVVSLSTAQVDVNFNGKTEKRLGLFGTFEVFDSAKQLSDAGQKVYPSIEINPDFGGKGFAYLMGCALTDSPASIATERLQFNRVDPSRLNLTSDQAALLEFIEDAAPPSPAADGFFKQLTELLKPFSKQEPAPAAQVTPPAADPAAAFTTVLEGFAKSIDKTFTDHAAATAAAITGLDEKVTALSTKIDTTAAPQGEQRPLGTGPNAQFNAADVF